MSVGRVSLRSCGRVQLARVYGEGWEKLAAYAKAHARGIRILGRRGWGWGCNASHDGEEGVYAGTDYGGEGGGGSVHRTATLGRSVSRRARWYAGAHTPCSQDEPSPYAPRATLVIRPSLCSFLPSAGCWKCANGRARKKQDLRHAAYGESAVMRQLYSDNGRATLPAAPLVVGSSEKKGVLDIIDIGVDVEGSAPRKTVRKQARQRSKQWAWA
ncbi:hypothetical protein B0H16DRAFT_1479106 [Mycena metata]|uniref:Uncharacterized protein n=1 Tax=Mycena metata TaxID=1033252 RepID=A0AAD7MDS6_9AGAR|nr:hypothetical protein B0H16DRAFT_1479106 [Mycena metata]